MLILCPKRRRDSIRVDQTVVFGIIQVASLGGEILTSQPTAKAAVQGSEVNEEWIKARAAALGVPVELEKERQARWATKAASMSRSRKVVVSIT